MPFIIILFLVTLTTETSVTLTVSGGTSGMAGQTAATSRPPATTFAPAARGREPTATRARAGCPGAEPARSGVARGRRPWGVVPCPVTPVTETIPIREVPLTLNPAY